MKERASLWKRFCSAIHLDVDGFLSQISFLLCIINTEQFVFSSVWPKGSVTSWGNHRILGSLDHWHGRMLAFLFTKEQLYSSIHSITLLRYLKYNKPHIFKVYSLTSFNIHVQYLQNHRYNQDSKNTYYLQVSSVLLSLLPSTPVHLPYPQVTTNVLSIAID